MKLLIAYFSAQNRTKSYVEEVAKELNVDTFEIVPEPVYTLEDINYKNPESRCNIDYKTGRDVPFVNTLNNFEEYNTVLIGFPIWYGMQPNVVNTFIKSFDWTNKNVIVFATSGGGPLGNTMPKILTLLEKANKVDGQLIKTAEDLKAIVNSL